MAQKVLTWPNSQGKSACIRVNSLQPVKDVTIVLIYI